MVKMLKIVINNRYGGFSVSKAVYDELGIEWDGYGYIENKDLGIEDANTYAYRADPRLITAIEKIGLEESSGEGSRLKIVDLIVPWDIINHDGWESIHVDPKEIKR